MTKKSVIEEMSPSELLEHDIFETLKRTKCVKETQRIMKVGRWRVLQTAKSASFNFNGKELLSERYQKSYD